jgi:thymidylate synthase ThyX
LEDYEEFSESQLKILERFVSNSHSNVFVLRNLPEVIKGALFSRYSRSTLGLRSLLLKDFILNEESAFESIVGEGQLSSEVDQVMAIKKAQNFYDRILDGYGDDSIGELGGAHLAIEQVSMLAAKEIEDARIGGSPLEKSTRYVYFDQKVKGEYLFYREPILMTSAFRDLYESTCNHLFETYSRIVPPLTAAMEKDFPMEEGTSKVAYRAALRAKVLDCLRGLLPASTLTNMGVYGNGRFYEGLIRKMHTHSLAEMQDLGRKMGDELGRVIPSFVRRADPSHKNQQSFATFAEAVKEEVGRQAEEHCVNAARERVVEPQVKLVDCSENPVTRVAAAMLYEATDRGMHELQTYCGNLSDEELACILDAGSNARENRRHKSPRALEHAEFTFDIVADYGVYRDLHRHRMLTQKRQLLSCDYGYYFPQELEGTEMGDDYRQAMERASEAFETMRSEFPEEAQYVVPMAYNVRWYFHVNLRALQWLCELRSQPAGHPNYRWVAQEMARQLIEKVPAFERFFKFVDYDGHEMGRLGQEERKEAKKQATSVG